MTAPKPLADGFSVSSFVSPNELPALARQFRTIVNARPDAEEADQPSSSEIEQAARRLGLEYVHIPVVPGQITDEQVAAFSKALDTMPGPVLGFCKSGTRAASLWALSRAGALGADAIIVAATKAGFDLQGLRPRLAAKARG